MFILGVRYWQVYVSVVCLLLLCTLHCQVYFTVRCIILSGACYTHVLLSSVYCWQVYAVVRCGFLSSVCYC